MEASPTIEPVDRLRHKLTPARRFTKGTPRMMLIGQLFEFMSRNNFEDLGKNCITMGHGLVFVLIQ